MPRCVCIKIDAYSNDHEEINKYAAIVRLVVQLMMEKDQPDLCKRK